MKKALKGLLILLMILAIVLAGIYANHRLQLHKEAPLRAPLGQLVEVNGHQISLYAEGQGDRTLVFLSGGGTCSPILDFKALYATLSGEHRIVVVEKLGYGFSDVADVERSIASILADTRAALAAAGINGPYVLCPHSMSGIEALYWAQQYPEEVEAIIGLDMAVPRAYEDYQINMPILKLSQLAARLGITRLLPGIAESDAIKYGTLTDSEKDVYRAIFYAKTATVTMLNEVRHIKENAKLVQQGSMPQVPMLLFASNGVGTGWEAEEWRAHQEDFAQRAENARLLTLDCPHYVHDHEYAAISREIKVFLADMPH